MPWAEATFRLLFADRAVQGNLNPGHAELNLSAVLAAHMYMVVKMIVHSQCFAGTTGVQTQHITVHGMLCRVLSK